MPVTEASSRKKIPFCIEEVSANGRIKYPKMAEKMTHLFHGIRCGIAIESSSSIKEELFSSRSWNVRSGHAYNHKDTF